VIVPERFDLVVDRSNSFVLYRKGLEEEP